MSTKSTQFVVCHSCEATIKVIVRDDEQILMNEIAVTCSCLTAIWFKVRRVDGGLMVSRIDDRQSA